MKSTLFFFPLLVLIAIGCWLPLLKVPPEPLDQGLVLRYDRVGGQVGYNDHLTLDTSGTVRRDGQYMGTVEYNALNDLTTFLDANRYSSKVESLYDRYKQWRDSANPTAYHSKITVNAVSGIIVVSPDALITRMLSPYVAVPL